MPNPGSVVYLFSSTSRSRYLQDALDVLALPHRALYKFRYDTATLVARDLQQRTQTKEQYEQQLQSYLNNQALIVLVIQPPYDLQQWPPSDNQIQFYPLRHARIKRIEPIGSAHYVYFEVLDYVDWEQSNSLTWDTSIKDSQQIGRDDRPPHKYLSVAPDFITFDRPTDSDRAWEKIVETISSPLGNAVFYRVAGLSQIKSPHWWQQRWRVRQPALQPTQRQPVPLAEVVYDKSGYALIGGQTYTLEVVFYRPGGAQAPPAGTSIVPSIDDTFFSFRVGRTDVNSIRYDQQLIELIPVVQRQDVFTTISLGLAYEPQSTSSGGTAPLPNPFYAPAVNLVLKLSYPRRYLVGWLLVFAAGQILTKIDVSKYSPKSPGAFAIIAFGVGLLLTLWAVYKLLGKIPGAIG